MNYCAGLNVSLEETAICIVDEAGAIVRELRASSDPESLISAFNDVALPMVWIGLNACSQSAWLRAQNCLCEDKLSEAWRISHVDRRPQVERPQSSARSVRGLPVFKKNFCGCGDNNITAV